MKRLLLSLILLISVQAPAYASLHDIIDPVFWKNTLNEQIERLNIDFNADVIDTSVVPGAPLTLQYQYHVSPSYLPHSYNRIDKYDLNLNVNIGSMIKALNNTPLSFTMSRNQNFFFVRQFPHIKDAISAIPYSPKRLPITAKKALEQLEVGDFASIPANLTIAVGAGVSTSLVNPLLINAGANAYWVISGEFTIQIYKLDDSHVRMKMITTRAYTRGISSNTEANFTVTGVGLLDNALSGQVSRLFDKDMIQLGMAVTPGAQFILDYVFDLTDKKAAEAYDEILTSSFKFKDLVVLKNFGDNSEIKNKLFSTYEKADAIFQEDSKLPVENQRVRRLFKGFNNYTAKTRHLKLGLLLTSYTNDTTFGHNNLSFTDNNEKDIEFFYPTYTHYTRSLLGNFLWGYEDIQALTCFGLLPRETDLAGNKIPEIGLNFDRTDAILTAHEQRKVHKIINKQVPNSIMKKINWEDWLAPNNKYASRISFRLIINSEAYPYLKNYTEGEFQEKYLKYAKTKKFKYMVEEKRIRSLASSVYKILQNNAGAAEDSIRKLIELNKHQIFADSGVGFLISLLPEEKLNELLYIKIELLAQDQKTIKLDFGKMNHQMLYTELAEIQSKIGNRSYDLRVPKTLQP
jgi:hypothetical protein